MVSAGKSMMPPKTPSTWLIVAFAFAAVVIAFTLIIF
jgi:hypothetical protein